MTHTVLDLLTKIEAMKDTTLALRAAVERNRDEHHIRHMLEQITDMARQVASTKFDKNIKVGKK